MDPVAQEAFQYVTHLASEIGTRTIGSAACKATAGWIADRLAESGYSIEYQPFDCPDWSEEVTGLQLGSQRLEAAANTFSPSCDVKAPTLPLGTFAELEEASLGGRIPIFYGELAQHELAAKGAIYVPPRDRRIIDILEHGHPPALLTINPTLLGTWRLVEDFDLDIPSATVSGSTGLTLLENAGQEIHLRIQTRRNASSSANVIGRLEGASSARIVLCAHYDTKVDTPGAYDNAAGVAVVLTVARLLAAQPPRHSLEIVAFSGEEMYGLGDMTYAKMVGDDFSGITAALNVDGVGPRTAANTAAIFSASEEFAHLLSSALECYPGVARVDPWPASDHYIFYSHGVPSLAFSSIGIRDIYHTPEDRLRWISPEKLGEAVRLVDQLVRQMDVHERSWFRTPGRQAGL